MKIIAASLLMACATTVGQMTEQQLKLAREMQQAVLKDEDIVKVQALLDRGIDINSPIACGTFGVLDGAVSKENVEMLKFLLRHGAHPRGREIILAACAHDDEKAVQMVQLLLGAGVAPNTRDENSNALISAAYHQNQELVRLLISQPGMKLVEFDSGGYTALMWAVKHGSLAIVDLLLRAGADPATANDRGETAMTVARKVIENQKSIIAKLQSASK